MAAKKSSPPKGNTPGTKIATLQQEIAKQAAAVSGSVGSATGNRIRLTQDKQFASPDGTKTQGPINLVVIDFNTHHDYWDKPFKKDNPEPPVCFAVSEPASLQGRIDTLVPSNNSPEKQAEACGTCMMNQYASGANGVGKACKNSRLLACVSPDEDPETAPILLLGVPPASLKNWDNYVRKLSSRQTMPVTVITQVSMDAGSDYATLVFTPVAENGNLAAHWARMSEAQKLLVQEPDLSQRDAAPAKAAPRRPASKKTGARRSA